MKKKESKLKKAEENIIKKSLLFTKQKPLFVLVVDIFLIAILIILLTSSVSTPTDDASLAKEAYINNNTLIDQYIQVIDLQLQEPDQVPLDIAYLNSIKDDLIWLKSRQETVYYSKPIMDVPVKELAFHMFMQLILQINDDFVVDIGEPNYQERIDAALKLDYTNQQLISDEELEAGLSTAHDVVVFKETQDALFSDYIELKKNLVSFGTSIERKYAESKKLTWLSYSEINPDFNADEFDTNSD